MDYIEHYKRDLSLFDYAGELSPFQREDERRRFQTLVELGEFRKGDLVLDIGSGSGWLSKLMAAKGVYAYGLDLSPEQWRRGSEILGGRRSGFVVADALSLPFKGGSLDGVILSEVLEHLSEPARVLQEGLRVLRFGGRLLLSVPANEKIRYTLCIHCNRPTPINAHLHSFDRGRLRNMCREASFEVTKMLEFMPGPLSLLGLNRFLSFLPYSLWRVIERLSLGILGRARFLICLGEKSSSEI